MLGTAHVRAQGLLTLMWPIWAYVLIRSGKLWIWEVIRIMSYRTSTFMGRVCHSCGSVTQSCLTLCDSMDHSPLGFSIQGISQARILERVAISSLRRSS